MTVGVGFQWCTELCHIVQCYVEECRGLGPNFAQEFNMKEDCVENKFYVVV